MQYLRIVLSTLVLLGIFPTHALGAVTLGVSPMKLEVQLTPGEQRVEQVQVFNPGNTPLNVTSQISDYKVNSGGVPSFGNPMENPLSAGQWITLDPDQFELRSGETKNIRLKIQVPKGAAPGGHYGAVLFQFGGGSSGQTSVGVSGRIAVVNMISIPGAVKREGILKEISIPFLSAGYPVPISLTINNTGTIHLPLTGTVEIQNWHGGTITSIPITESYLFPNSTKTLKLSLDSGSMFGFYQAKVKFNDSDIHNLTKLVYFVVFPWPLLLGILFTAFGLFKLGVKRGRSQTPQ